MGYRQLMTVMILMLMFKIVLYVLMISHIGILSWSYERKTTLGRWGYDNLGNAHTNFYQISLEHLPVIRIDFIYDINGALIGKSMESHSGALVEQLLTCTVHSGSCLSTTSIGSTTYSFTLDGATISTIDTNIIGDYDYSSDRDTYSFDNYGRFVEEIHQSILGIYDEYTGSYDTYEPYTNQSTTTRYWYSNWENALFHMSL